MTGKAKWKSWWRQARLVARARGCDLELVRKPDGMHLRMFPAQRDVPSRVGASLTGLESVVIHIPGVTVPMTPGQVTYTDRLAASYLRVRAQRP